MNSSQKSVIVGTTSVLFAALLVGIGLFIAMTFSPILGVLMAIGGLIPWGWACFANKEYFSES